MQLQFCEVCHKKVKATDKYNDRDSAILCSKLCLAKLTQFNVAYSDKSIERSRRLTEGGDSKS